MRHRLYQGADHLLLVQSTGFTEDYRRLYYREIGCVVVRRTLRRRWWGFVWGLLAAIVLWILVYVSLHGRSTFALGFWGVVLGLAIGAFLINLLRGPTCACYITTQVQTVQVPTPQRLSRVPRLVDFLREKAAGVTGGTTAPASL